MKPQSLTPLIVGAALISSSQAAVININDFTVGQTPPPASVEQQLTDISTPNGGPVTPATNGSLSYLVTTFTFGAQSQAHLEVFYEFTGGQDRLGVRVQDNGRVDTTNQGDPGDTVFDIGGGGGAGFMAGQTVTMIIRSYYHANNDGLRATLGTSDDMLMNVWVNPDGTATENTPVGGFASNGVATASMLGDGNLHTLWNSNTYGFLQQEIQNQGTPGTAGDSSIVNTVLLTGSDATFANALAVATIPEPSAALLGGLGLLGLLRRRR